MQVGIRGGIDDAEHLGVHVRVVLPRVGLRVAHDLVGGALVGVRLDHRAIRCRVRVGALVQPVEGGAVGQLVVLVQEPEDVVEGPVLEHEHDDVVESRLAARVEGVEARRGTVGIDRTLHAGDHRAAGGEPAQADARGAEEVAAGWRARRLLGRGSGVFLIHHWTSL